MTWRKFLIFLGMACAVVFSGGFCGWFSSQPTYHGRTAAEWVDHSTLFALDRKSAKEGNGSMGPYSAEILSSDPAWRALKIMGSNAVPGLLAVLDEPAKWSIVKSVHEWLRWQWKKSIGGQSIPRPRPAYWSPEQQVRANAAAFFLLALGTNAHAGYPLLADRFVQVTKKGVLAPFGPNLAASIVSQCLPERAAEMVSGISSGLNHPDARMRTISADATASFGAAMPLWENKLFNMATNDPDVGARIFSMQSLRRAGINDRAVLGLLQDILKNPATSVGERAAAASLLGSMKAKAKFALPLLKAVMDNGDRKLKQDAKIAIYQIEGNLPPD